MQPPDPRHARNCEQQFSAMQSPQGPPGEGHVIPPHVPFVHVPEQHSAPVMQKSPSGLH